MAIKYLKSDQLPAFLEALAKDARVVAPVKTEGVVQFQPWAPGTNVELDVLLAKQSPKEFVFLQTETYLKFGYEMAPAPEGAEAGPNGQPPLDAPPHRSRTQRQQDSRPGRTERDAQCRRAGRGQCP